jgi:uncharacterized phage infection (PIP) family protein YhgE
VVFLQRETGPVSKTRERQEKERIYPVQITALSKDETRSFYEHSFLRLSCIFIMEYKEKVNSYYREKSKQEAKNKRKGITTRIIPLDRIPFQDIRSRMQELRAVIQGLEELSKQYEMDISYDLHDTIQEFDQVNQKLEGARAQYKELLDLKEKKEATLREEYTKAEDALSRLLDTYRKTDDLEEKKDIYKQQRPFQQKILSRYKREMKEEGDGFRLFTLYRPIQEIKL